MGEWERERDTEGDGNAKDLPSKYPSPSNLN